MASAPDSFLGITLIFAVYSGWSMH